MVLMQFLWQYCGGVAMEVGMAIGSWRDGRGDIFAGSCGGILWRCETMESRDASTILNCDEQYQQHRNEERQNEKNSFQK